MVANERLNSRQDFVGTGECARCHAKRTASQLTTPMAHASTPANSSDILRANNHLSLQLGPYSYAISSNAGAGVYSSATLAARFPKPLAWAFGLGNKGQTYIYVRNGFTTRVA